MHAVCKDIGQRPLYRNRIDAVRSNIPYRSSGANAHGRLLHPRPTVHSQQTAIVVGRPARRATACSSIPHLTPTPARSIRS